jgi:hypothetical protein
VDLLLNLIPLGSVLLAFFVTWWGWAILATIIAGFFFTAGLKLQRELDASRQVNFDCFSTFSARHRKDGRSRFRIWVTNNGPRSTFYARITRFSGVPDDWHTGPGGYEIMDPLWEKAQQTGGSAQEIPRGGRCRIELAELAESTEVAKRLLCFLTVQQGKPMLGNHLELDDDATLELFFTVEVVNDGDREQIGYWNGHITIPPRGQESTFTLSRDYGAGT